MLYVLLVALGACGPASVEPKTGSLEACPPSSAPAPSEAPRLLVQDGHSGAVNWLALSGDGRLLASAGLDGTLRLWDTQSGLLLDRLAAPGAIWGVALDARGEMLAYALASGGDKPHAIEIVALSTGRRVEVKGFGSFALSPDGATLAVAKSALELFDTKTGKRRQAVPLDLAPDGQANAVAFDATGTRVAVAIPGALVEIAMRDGKPKRTTVGDAKDVMSWISDVVIIDKGVLVKRGTNVIELVRADGRLVKVLDKAGMIAASHDRLWSATAGEKDYSHGLPNEDEGHELRALTFQGRETLRVPLEREPFRITAAAGGGMLAVTYFDAVRGTALQLIDPKTGKTLHTIEGRFSGVSSLAMSRDGQQLAIGSLAALAMWRMPDAEMWFATRENRLRGADAIAYDASGKQLASIEAAWLRVRSATSGRLLRAWKHDIGHPALLAFRGRTSELVTADDLTGDIYGWDLSAIPAESQLDADNLIRAHEEPSSKRIAHVDFEIEEGAVDPNGKHAVLGDREGRIALVDLDGGKVVWTIESKTSFGYTLAFDADGKRVLLSGHRYQPPTASHSGVPILRAFDVRDGKSLVDVEAPTAGAVAVRADVIAVAGVQPALFDASTLKVRARLALPDTRFTAVVADPARPVFLFGGAAGSTAVVDTAGKLRAVLVATPGGDWIATTPDGYYRASLDGARRIAWRYTRPLEAFTFEQFADRFEQPELLKKRILGVSSAEAPPRARPPRITSLSVPGKTDGERAHLVARVADDRQVSHVFAYVNGRLAAEERVCAAKAEVPMDVPLGPGANRIAVVAHGEDGLASHARIADVRSTAHAPRPTLWVLAVGVSRYRKLPPQFQLEFADDDARAIAKALGGLAGHGQPFSRARVRTLVDDQVSVKAVESALAELEAMAPNDLAVVFLAGHGVKLADGKMRFLTRDATLDKAGAARAGVGWATLERAIDRAHGRVLMLLDACHSGHVITGFVAPNEALAKALAAGGRSGAVVFAASRGSQLSYEVGDASGSRALELAQDGEPTDAGKTLARGHGLFTSALLEALGGRAPDRDKSGMLELDELIGHVSERVRVASGGRQTPWVARRELFGDFALVPLK